MKITTHRLSKLPLAAAALLAAAILPTQAQSWQPVYNSAAYGVGGVCGDVGADAFGNVFAVGRNESTDGNSVAIVQAASGNPGSIWELLDTFFELGRSYSHYRAVAVDPNVPGHIFAGGNLNNILPNGSGEFESLWIIRERDPATGLWHTADDYSDIVGQNSVSDIKVTQTGDVYAAGGDDVTGWLVRRRLGNGSEFANVDVLPFTGTINTAAWGMTVHPVHGVIVVGEVNGLWTVRQSPSGNPGSWLTRDNIVPKPTRGEWGGGRASAAAVSSTGTIYVAGTLWNKTRSMYHWVVRSSADAGITWSISDNVAPPTASAEAFGIVAAGDGSIYVSGRVGELDGYHWVVRRGRIEYVKQGKKTVPVTIWETIDNFQLEPGKNSRANAITIDASGNIFAGGSGLDANDIQRSIVRRLPAN